MPAPIPAAPPVMRMVGMNNSVWWSGEGVAAAGMQPATLLFQKKLHFCITWLKQQDVA
jgi:hypothetical protein